MQRRSRLLSILSLRFTYRLAVAFLLLAGFGPGAVRLAAQQCPYSSIQTRVQLNPAMEWRTSLTLPQRETFRVGVFFNGTGQFAGSSATVTVTLPNNTVMTPGIGGYVIAGQAGAYVVRGSCGNLSGTVSVTVDPAPRFIWDISPDQANANNWNDFYTRLDKIRDAGATATHLSFNWDIIDRVGWSYADNQMNAALSRGLTPFAYTGATPIWALPPGTNQPAFYLPDESKVNEFKSFHRDLAARFCGRVRYYEFWNEENGCGLRTSTDTSCSFSSAKQVQYAKWLKRWYEAMKEGCEDTVLAPGGFDCNVETTGNGCAEQLDQLYAAIAANPEGGCLNNCFDAFAIHPYGEDDGAPALNTGVINAVMNTLASHGQSHKLLWLDEWAIPSSDSRPGQVTAGLDEIQGGNAFEARYLTLTDADVPGGGLMNGDLTPRASYWAFCNHARTNNRFVAGGHWKGRYFKNTTLSGTAWIRDDGTSTLFFDWGSGSPICDFGDSFSARWTRSIDLPAGTYRFTSRTDDGVRVWVDDTQVINHWENQLSTVWTGDIQLSAGTHRVKMEYFDQGGSAMAQLSWPKVSTTVCGNINSSTTCNANSACQWSPCASFCLPKYSADQPTCICASKTTQTSCNTPSSQGCNWFACKNKCLAKGTSTYAVCGTGTP